MSGRRRPRPDPGSIVRGLFLLARFDGSGIEEFGNSVAAFSASLAPLVAFPIVGAGLIASQGHHVTAAIVFLSRLSAVLMQPVAIEIAARLTRSHPRWLRTSTALNWSVWLLLPLVLIAALLGNILMALHVPEHLATYVTVGLSLLYLAVIQWFILRAGLRIKGWQALLILIATNVAVFFVDALPYILHPGLIAQLVSHRGA